MCPELSPSLLSPILGHTLIPLETKEKAWHRTFSVLHPKPLQTPPSCRHLQVGAEVAGDIRTVTLAEHSDLLLDVLNLILGLLQVNDLDGHHLLGMVVNPLVHLPK